MAAPEVACFVIFPHVVPSQCCTLIYDAEERVWHANIIEYQYHCKANIIEHQISLKASVSQANVIFSGLVKYLLLIYMNFFRNVNLFSKHKNICSEYPKALLAYQCHIYCQRHFVWILEMNKCFNREQTEARPNSEFLSILGFNGRLLAEILSLLQEVSILIWESSY